MKIEISGKRQLTCDSCSAVLAENSYYPEKRGAISLSLKNQDGDHVEHSYCSEDCVRNHLNSRHEMKNKSVQVVAEEKQVTTTRDGLVTIDFSKAIAKANAAKS